MPNNLIHLPTKLDFEGPHNFRDMGGYPVGEGRTFKSGMLYRSDHLGTLTEADQGLIAEIGIKTIVDFRGPDEHNETPDNIADPEINQVWLPIASEGSRITELRRRLEAGLLTIEEAHEYLIVANRNYIVNFGHVYKQFTALLLDPASYPLVFHCTAGKDRAGFAAVLSLMILGATKETVFHDYMATNHCTANYIEGILAGLADMPASKASPDAIRTLMRVEPEFLQTALDTVDEKFQDFDTYLKQALGVGPQEKAKLAEILCDPL